jgi:hydrogenase maturation protease
MTLTGPRILVAGVGNIFLGDDAFGIEVLRHLSRRPPMPGVRLVDFGIRGLDLVYALLEGYDLTILVDATMRGGSPGTLYVLEPELPLEAPAELETHGMNPSKVLALATAMGAEPGKLLVVGCEPTPGHPVEDAFLPSGLSEPVARAIEPAAARIEDLVHCWIRDRTPKVGPPAPVSAEKGV